MEMNLRQSYFAMFYLLDGYYDTTKNGVLGSLLGSLNPNLFTDGMPADQAAWADWGNCVKKAFIKDKLSPKEAFQAVIKFITFYQEEFGYDLEWLINEMRSTQPAERWANIVQKVIREE
jgi:hypothetical protein